jgi:NAD-dependent SIR2 family protein deacetylase
MSEESNIPASPSLKRAKGNNEDVPSEDLGSLVHSNSISNRDELHVADWLQQQRYLHKDTPEDIADDFDIKLPSTVTELRKALHVNEKTELQWAYLHKILHQTQPYIRLPSTRMKLQSVNTLDDVLRLLQSSTHITLITGAGVSTSCGIPDFRSKGGIYSQVNKYTLPEPEDMFDLLYFKSNPHPFFHFVKELLPGNFTPSASHHFLSALETRGKLLRNYTQNLDDLEIQAGVSVDKLYQCHGTFRTATCMICQNRYTLEDIRLGIEQQHIPHCTASGCLGVIKPDIVMFGEQLEDQFAKCMKEDKVHTDLLIVMGTSLKVS